MGTIRLAANYIDGSNLLSDGWGHLQVVYADGLIEDEIEVQAGWFATAGDWRFHEGTLDHLETPNYGEQDQYVSIDLDLGGRSAESVWGILKQVNDQYYASGIDIDYDQEKNSNSYVNTLLEVIGFDLSNHLSAVTPADVGDGFPGAHTDVLNDTLADDFISLEIHTYAGDDYVKTGRGNDIIHSFDGDLLIGGAGQDTYEITSPDFGQSVTEIDSGLGSYNPNNLVYVNSSFNLSDELWSSVPTISDGIGYSHVDISAHTGFLFEGDYHNSRDIAFDSLTFAAAEADGSVYVKTDPYSPDECFAFSLVDNVYGVQVEEQSIFYVPTDDGDLEVKTWSAAFAAFAGDDLYVWVETVYEDYYSSTSTTNAVAILADFASSDYNFLLA